MADYWVSNERKYCDFCKCWLSDNKASISFHENGKKHKLNVAKRLTDISRSSAKSEQERKKMDDTIRKMEEAAMLSYAQDIHARRDLTAHRVSVVMDAAATTSTATTNSGASSSRPRQVDPMRLPGNSDDEEDETRVSIKKVDPETVPNASLWVEGRSDEGYTYYWNVKTNESVWKAPKEGFLSYEEYQNINKLAIKQQEAQQAAEAKDFRENANEEVARYNRERLKLYRKPDTQVEKEARRTEEERKRAFKTEEQAATPELGGWQVVETKPPPEQIDWELPETGKVYIPPPVSNPHEPSQPPVKRFKEKTIETLDPTFTVGASTSFKKRKFAAKGNPRQRLDND